MHQAKLTQPAHTDAVRIAIGPRGPGQMGYTATNCAVVGAMSGHYQSLADPSNSWTDNPRRKTSRRKFPVSARPAKPRTPGPPTNPEVSASHALATTAAAALAGRSTAPTTLTTL
jgi:hypothetical protein